MKILVSEYAGFCFGVERAINIVKSSAKDKQKIYTLGPLIHNPQVVRNLEKKGVYVIEDIDKISDGDSVVIRSHGITKDIQKKLKKKNINIIDATCPYVKNAQEKAEYLKENNYRVIIYGEKKHPEVKAILSYTDYTGMVLEKTDDFISTQKQDKYGIVSQTTRNLENFSKICKKIIHYSAECRVFNTICNATYKRQKDAVKIARNVDFMIIVGGKNSANTTKLYNIVNEIIPAIHIETAAELEEDNLKKYKKIGITAGASTPEYLINEVVKFLNKIDRGGN